MRAMCRTQVVQGPCPFGRWPTASASTDRTPIPQSTLQSVTILLTHRGLLQRSPDQASYLSARLRRRGLLALGPALLLRGLSRLRRGCCRRPAPLPVRGTAEGVPAAADDVNDMREVLGDGPSQLVE